MFKINLKLGEMIRSTHIAAVIGAMLLGSVPLGSLPRAVASLVSYDIGAVPAGQAGGFRATYLHAATSSIIGSNANGGRRSGNLSNALTGSMQGDLNGNILSGISGEISGMLKGLTSLFSNTSTTPFALRLGSDAGGTGALAFETEGSGTGQFTGGFLDYDLVIGGMSADSGTFFFQPAAQMGGSSLNPSSPLVPNRGNSDAFTLWGNNYMHDGNGYTEQSWLSFLEGTPLEYGGGSYVTRSNVVNSPLGIDIFADMSGGGGGGVVPEPESLAVWVLLAGLGLTVISRKLEARNRVTVSA
jgi:hypothetical protein